MRPILLVLAAGMGSRFGGLKQIEPVGPNGEWILDFSVFDAVESGFGKVVFVIREEMEEAFSVVRDRYAGRIEVEFAFQKSDDLPTLQHLSQQREKPWGTGHAVYAARNALDAPFAVINADDFYGRDAFRSLATFLSKLNLADNEYALIGYQLENTLSENGSVSRGICHAATNELLESVEEHTEIRRNPETREITAIDSSDNETSLSSKCPVSLNCWGFPASFLAELESLLSAFLEENGETPKTEFYLPFAVDALLRSDKATACIIECSSRWLGVTHREDLAYVQTEISKLFEQGEYTAPLW
jgi:choline kinase